MPVLRTWWIENGPTTSTASPSESRLETIAFVSWSAQAAATATSASPTHCARAGGERPRRAGDRLQRVRRRADAHLELRARARSARAGSLTRAPPPRLHATHSTAYGHRGEPLLGDRLARSARRCRTCPSSIRSSAASISRTICSAFSSSDSSTSRSSMSLAWSARCWSPAALESSPSSVSSSTMSCAAAKHALAQRRGARCGVRRARCVMRVVLPGREPALRLLERDAVELDDLVARRVARPRSGRRARRRRGVLARSATTSSFARPRSGAERDTQLPGVAEPPDDLERRAPGATRTRSRTGRARRPRRVRASVELHARRIVARAVDVGRAGESPVDGARLACAASAPRRASSLGLVGVRCAVRDDLERRPRSIARMRRVSASSCSFSAIASRSTRRASALASWTITSASRRACSFMSCAARSAETSVERSSVSSSTWRATSVSSTWTRSPSSARSRQTASKLSAISSIAFSTLERRYPKRPRRSSRCRTSTGVRGITSPPCSQDSCRSGCSRAAPATYEREDGDDRRQVERADRRDEAAEEPQVGLADVVQELPHALERRRARRPGPTRR